MEQLVFPAPVGAQMRMFSAVNSAVSHTLLWMRFRLDMPLRHRQPLNARIPGFACTPPASA